MRTSSFIAVILCLVLMGGCKTPEAWAPKNDQKRYADVLLKMSDIEPISNFLATEKKLITQPTADYYKLRWDYLKTVTYEHPDVATPAPAANRFVAACLDQKILKPTAKKAFSKAAITLGFELITDKVGFATPSEGDTPHRNIPYVSYNGYPQNLDLFTPQNPRIKPVPCIIFIHGGGWAVHKRAWFEAFARYVANKGYAAATIDYRMLNAVDSPVSCVYDAKAAVRWVRANAQKYGIDPNKIGVSGASAGAQLAAILATTPNDPALEGPQGNLQVSSQVQAAVGFATPTMTGTRKTWPWETGQKPTWYDSISPYMHLTKTAAPMKFIHGTADKTVDVAEAIDAYTLYQTLGISSELEFKARKPHVFYMNKETAESAFQFFKKIFEPK